jgi:hypothetical protein
MFLINRNRTCGTETVAGTLMRTYIGSALQAADTLPSSNRVVIESISRQGYRERIDGDLPYMAL